MRFAARMAKAKGGASLSGTGLPKKVVVHVASGLASLDRAALVKDLKAAAPKLPTPTFQEDLGAGIVGRQAQLKIANARLRDTRVPDEFWTASSNDFEFEAGVDAGQNSVPWTQLISRLYDGDVVAQAGLGALAEGDRDRGTLHLWVTRRLLCTYDKDGMRYHARFAVFGYPVVFSVLGMGMAAAPSVEATLLARELSKRGAGAGDIEAEVDKQFPEERLDVDDAPTVTRAIGSVLLQAAARDAGAGPFCDDKTCRLFNAHRKREVREAMLGAHLCATHSRLFGSGGRGK